MSRIVLGTPARNTSAEGKLSFHAIQYLPFISTMYGTGTEPWNENYMDIQEQFVRS
jgi:hypothetical protein